MRRGDIYRVFKPQDEPKRYRCYVLVSRREVIESGFSTVICAPVYTKGRGLSTQVAVGVDEGLKHESWITCDNLRSIAKAQLTQFVGSLSPPKQAAVDRALRIALGVD
ncbi:MAG: type II toxin-antitoxin system PemK/MazF family toxin [Candidatus Sulfotelmatobacter sp.]